MTPVRLLGISLCDRIRRSIATAMESWSAEWCVEEWFAPDRTSIIVRQPQTPLWMEAKRNVACACTTEEARAWLHLSDDDLRAMIGDDGRGQERPLDVVMAQAGSLREMLGAEREEQGCQTVRSVLLQARMALLHSIVAALGGRDSRATFAASSTLSRRDILTGYAEVVVSDGDVSFAILLSPVLAARPAEPKPIKPLGGLEPRKDAVLSSACRASLVLDAGNYSLPQLKQLQVGETLKTAVPLTQPFLLSVGASIGVPAFLGRVGEHKAITFIEEHN